jgi:hypothetical protein
LRHVIRSLVLAALLAGIVPAHAGPYSVAFRQTRGARVSGTVAGGYRFDVQIATADLTDAAGPLRLLPPTEAPNPDMNTEAFGYIRLTRAGKVVDVGLDVVRPVTLDFDPALMSGHVIFSVKSRTNPGKYITVNLALTGNNDLAPTSTNPIQPSLTPGVPPKSSYLTVNAIEMLSRSAKVTGTVRSDVASGGGVLSAPIARMFTGVAGMLRIDTGCVFTVGDICRV